MERLIMKQLFKWKNSPYRKPLILKGVRQVGKTWILKEFGRQYYENTAYFNFDENEEYRQFFETTKDVNRILQNLMLAGGQKITPEKTLIIFDEVQDCMQELAVRTAFVLAENLGGDARAVETVRTGAQGRHASLTFSERYVDAEEVNRRYQLEDRLVEAVSEGDAGKAHRTWKENGKFLSGLRFMSDSRQDQLAGAAIMRTLIRTGAKQGGLSPVRIDSISQEYAQRMKHAGSKEELNRLIVEMNGRVCEAVRERRRTGLSPAVQRGLDYMEINLSKSMTTEEIARASGEKKRNFVNRFCRETGMTVKAYLAAMRCGIAAQLLADGDASVQEIAAYVGYTDNNYFSKVFRANFGMTPQAYRVLHKV